MKIKNFYLFLIILGLFFFLYFILNEKKQIKDENINTFEPVKVPDKLPEIPPLIKIDNNKTEVKKIKIRYDKVKEANNDILKLLELFEKNYIYDAEQGIYLNKLVNENNKIWIVGYEDEFFKLYFKMLNTPPDNRNWDTGVGVFSTEMIRSQLMKDILTILKNTYSYKFSHPEYPEPKGGFDNFYKKIETFFKELTNYDESKLEGILFISGRTSNESFDDYYIQNENDLTDKDKETMLNIRAINDLMYGEDPYSNTVLDEEMNKYIDKNKLKESVINKLALFGEVADEEVKENIKKNNTIRELVKNKPLSSNEVDFIIWLRSVKLAYYENEFISFLNELFYTLSDDEKFWLIKKMTKDFYNIYSSFDYLNQEAQLLINLIKNGDSLNDSLPYNIYLLFKYAYTNSPNFNDKEQTKNIILYIISELNILSSSQSLEAVKKFNVLLGNSTNNENNDSHSMPVDW